MGIESHLFIAYFHVNEEIAPYNGGNHRIEVNGAVGKLIQENWHREGGYEFKDRILGEFKGRVEDVEYVSENGRIIYRMLWKDFVKLDNRTNHFIRCNINPNLKHHS